MRSAMARVRKKGAPPSELSRDIYGFIVKPQHVQRYREFASIYKEEEAERSERWDHFLQTYNVPIKADESQLDQKQEPEAETPRSAQRWSELRPSLSIVEQAVSNLNGEQTDSTISKQPSSTTNQENGEPVKPRKTDASGTDEDSDDEFYDLDKADGDSSALSDPSDSEAPAPEDFPWKEELQFLVRGGVPMALRGELWQVFVRTKSRKVEGHYDSLLAEKSINGNGNANGGSHQASDASTVEKYAAQIEKDLPRTFPGHPALDEDGRNALRRLLIAYARHNPDVGYCQAMNFFAGLLLLLMPEENAFWTLTGIIDEYFEGYYSEKLLEAQVDQLVFEELTRGQFPRLISHLESIGVQVPWIIGPWFLSIFVNVLPWESVLRVWDVLLFEGNRTMLFRTALALLELHAPALMATRDAGDFISLMQALASSTFDSSQLVLTACMGFQKINQEQLQALRTKHRPAVLATLDERALELRLWRNSQAALAKKLSRKFSVLASVEKASATIEDGLLLSASSDLLESDIIDEEDEEDEEKYSTDLEEQVLWLKNELCLALEEKKRANARAEELDVALMEIVKEDNRRELSAKVEKLEAELAETRQVLSDKQEQEKAMLQVMLRVEQEQKIAEDARRFAEQDAAAQRQAATRLQEKYEEAIDKLAAAEKRAVMAETMLEATLQYEAGQPGAARRQSKEEETLASKWSWPLSSPKPTPDGANKVKYEPPNSDAGSKPGGDEENRKPGLFSRMNWRDRNKGKVASPVQSREEPSVTNETINEDEKSPLNMAQDQAEVSPAPPGEKAE